MTWGGSRSKLTNRDLRTVPPMKKFLVALFTLLLAACGQQSGEEKSAPAFSPAPPTGHAPREYVFAIHPLHNPVRLLEVYGPLVDFLNRNVEGASFRLEASRNYGEFEKKLYARKFEFALPNPYQTLNSLQHGYHVIGKMGDDHKFTGVILVRRDSGIHKVTDLKGKKVSYPAPTALAATMMPQYFLHTHGLDINRDIENLYVGSQESSIMNVYLGQVAAGATWPLPWEAFQKEHPEKARELVVQWETEPLINNGIVARDDVPAKIVTRVAELLASLHTSEEGRAILARMPLSRFELADDARYRVIDDFLHRFSQSVRPLDEARP
jgi:phosphonate transport system substrate-binding protein